MLKGVTKYGKRCDRVWYKVLAGYGLRSNKILVQGVTKSGARCYKVW